MATVVVNQPDLIEFRNIVPTSPSDSPALVVQAGTWQSETGGPEEAGIVFDIGASAVPPLLNPTDARKLAKWLLRAADQLEGVGSNHKKKNNKRHWDEDDEDEY